MKECSICKINKEYHEFYKDKRTKDGLYSSCKKCHHLYYNKNTYKEYIKKWIENNREKWNEYQRKRRNKDNIHWRKYMNEYMKKRRNFPVEILKIKKRKIIQSMLACKKLIKLPCEICGNIKSEAHHNNYTENVNIMWLCRKHHSELHRQLRKLNQQIKVG